MGVGEIGTDVCKNLCKTGFAQIQIANRTLEKSINLAKHCNVEMIEWQQLAEQIIVADVTISAVPGLQPFLMKSYLVIFADGGWSGELEAFAQKSFPCLLQIVRKTFLSSAAQALDCQAYF